MTKVNDSYFQYIRLNEGIYYFVIQANNVREGFEIDGTFFENGQLDKDRFISK